MNEGENKFITISDEDLKELKADRDSLSGENRSQYREKDKNSFFEEEAKKILGAVIAEGKSEAVKPFEKLLEDEDKEWWRVVISIIAEEGKSDIVSLKNGEIVLNGNFSWHSKKDEELDEYLSATHQPY